MLFKKKTTWHKVLDAESLVGNELKRNIPVLVEAGGKTICIVRLPEGYYAVSDTCPHQGASLSGGYCSEGSIVCPWHHYSFDLKTGRQNGGGGDYVMTHPVEIREDGIYVGLEKTVFSLFD